MVTYVFKQEENDHGQIVFVWRCHSCPEQLRCYTEQDCYIWSLFNQAVFMHSEDIKTAYEIMSLDELRLIANIAEVVVIIESR